MLTKSRVWRSAVTATRKPPKYERDCQVVPNLYALAPRPLEERILSHARRIHRHGARHSRFNTEDLGYPRQSLVWNMRMNDVQLPMELLELDTSLREPTFKIPSWSVSDYPDLTPEDLCVIETFRDNERFGVTHFASMSAQWEVDEKLFREIAKKFYLPGGYARDKQLSPYLTDVTLFVPRRIIYTACVIARPPELASVPLELLAVAGNDVEWTIKYRTPFVAEDHPNLTEFQKRFIETFRDNDKFNAICRVCSLRDESYLPDMSFPQSIPRTREAYREFLIDAIAWVKYLFCDPSFTSLKYTEKDWIDKYRAMAGLN
jgi:hypothetical protein